MSTAEHNPGSGEAHLPNIWSRFNLLESPFFQDTLGRSDALRYPTELFVGRALESRRLLTGIGSAPSSRQAVAGPVGIGKTTLVQHVKAEALRAGYWSTDALVPLLHGDTTETVMLRILSQVYETVLALGTGAVEHDRAVQETQQLVRAFRLRTGGFSFSVAQLGGVGATAGQQVVTPPGAGMLEGPRLLAQLLRLAVTEGARGVLLHLNNLEHTTDADVETAGSILRDLRDLVLLQEHLHTIVVGTTDAVQAVVSAHPQVRGVFASPLVLEPLAAEEVLALLEARYHYLVLDPAQPPSHPVTPDAVMTLYALYRGDLRGTLKALDDGTQLLLGYALEGPGAALSWDDVRAVLAQRYAAELRDALPAQRADQLRALVTASPRAPVTQAMLRDIWRLSQSRVSRVVRELVAFGYLVPLPREGGGGEPVRYALSGRSRLIFG